MMSPGNAKPQLGATNNRTPRNGKAELGLGVPVPRAAGATKNQLWMREYWDRYIRDEKHFHATVNYIYNNPVKAGLCAEAHDWPWSSAYAGHR